MTLQEIADMTAEQIHALFVKRGMDHAAMYRLIFGIPDQWLQWKTAVEAFGQESARDYKFHPPLPNSPNGLVLGEPQLGAGAPNLPLEQ